MSVQANNLHGRRKIFTDKDYVDESNVVDVLNDTLRVHSQNAREIQYLYDYYRGKQPILLKEKATRPDINNKVLENRANEIVSFKVAYSFGEPVQYVNRSEDDSKTPDITTLNDYMFAEGKEAKDKSLAEWFTICGTGYRMILPSDTDGAESPFEIYTLDPRFNYTVYKLGLGEKAMCGIQLIPSKDAKRFAVYTDREYFEIKNDKVVEKRTHNLGGIPMIEYPLNNARLGAFEIVLPLLDSINELQSARLDSTEQFVQALMMFKGVDVDSEDFKALKSMGAFSIPADADVKYLVQELNQTQTQTLVDNLYETVLTICGMPSTSSGDTSDSSNNGAVILKNGWQGAEARAKDMEVMFERSEREFLRLAIRISNVLGGTKLALSDVKPQFTRHNYENISEKANVLMLLLSSSKVNPRLAFEVSGLFTDPETAYATSMEYYQNHLQEIENELSDI